MEKFKLLLDNYRKEIIATILLFVIILTIVGLFWYCSIKKEPQKNLEQLTSIKNEVSENFQVKQEQEEKDQQLSQKIYVDIKGEIKNPGVYITQEEERIIDVIQKAGGLTKNADTSVNNLSRKVKDEMVIIIYSKEEVKNFATTKEKESLILEEVLQPSETLRNDAALKTEDILLNQENITSSKSDKVSDSNNQQENTINKKVNINTATKEELLSISGIGESKAEAIIRYRTENSSFQVIEDIMKVSGIGESLFAKIKDFIEV